MQLPDQGNELFQNIKEARLQLNKLKQEASALSADPYSTHLLIQASAATTCDST